MAKNCFKKITFQQKIMWQGQRKKDIFLIMEDLPSMYYLTN